MSLVRLVAKNATHKELTELLVGMEEQCNRYRAAIEWALGESDEFIEPNPKVRLKKCRWRHELRERADLDGKSIV